METLSIPNIPYVGLRHPGNVSPEEFLENPHAGGNCETTAHAITLARGYRLPRVRSSELFSDQTATEHVPFTQDNLALVQTGDIIGLGRTGHQGYRGIHQGIVYKAPELIIVHNARSTGFEVKPLARIQQDPLHERVLWVKRPRASKFDEKLYNPKALKRIGLGFLAE